MKSQYRRQFVNAVRILTAIPVLLLMLFPSSGGIAQAAAPSAQGLTAELNFTSAPVVGRAAELVLNVAAAEGTDLQAEIFLPKGLVVVSGELTAAGKTNSSAAWKYAIVVKTTTEGEYKITAQVKAGAQVSVVSDLYLSSTAKSASVGKIPVKVSSELTMVPPQQVEGEVNSTSAPVASPDLKFAYGADALDGPQPASSQASEEAVALPQSVEKIQLREGLGLSTPENPLEFEVNPIPAEGSAVENISNNVLSISTPFDSTEGALIDRLTLDQHIYAPVIGHDSTLQGEDPNLLVGPDLVVVNLWTNTAPLMISEWNNIYFSVKNQGDTAVTTAFKVNMWVGGSLIDNWYIDALGIGYTAYSYTQVYISTPGQWSITGQVDANGNVTESNEVNNTLTKYWVWMRAGKDVIVEDIYSTTNPLVGGDWETLYLALRNVGNTNITETFYSKLYVGATQIGYWYTAGLDSQAATYGNVTISKTPGYYTVSASTDVTSAVAESSETNNTRAETWLWSYSGGSNLIVYDITSSTWPPTGGAAENITFAIKNTGTTPAYITQGEAVSALSVLGTQPGGSVKVQWDSELNTPSQIVGDIAVSGPAGQPEVAAANFFKTFAGLYGIRDAGQELAQMNIKSDELGMQHVRYQQKYQGLDVYGRQMIVHVGKDGQVTSGNGSFVADINLSVTPSIAADAALNTARQSASAMDAPQLEAARLVVYPVGAQAHLAWFVRITVDEQPYRAFVDAHTGAVLDHYSEIQDARNRQTYTASNLNTLPGTLILSEASAGSADTVAWTTHVNTGLVYNYWKNTFGRDSYDGAGAIMKSTVHYRTSYNNAFWNGVQMVYGDGDGVVFRSLGLALDVVGHELTHAVIDSVGGLNYVRESGALNESMADVFGAMIDRADWLMGEDVTTPAIAGDALRNMANPHAGYSYQPDNMTEFAAYTGATCSSANDNCGVHYNSGIPNKAAYLVSDGGLFRGVRVYGIGRAKTERIYWRALDVYFVPTTTFAQARSWLMTAAADIYGSNSQEVHTVEDAFAAVGIGSPSVFYTYLYIDNVYKGAWYTNELAPGLTTYGATTQTLAAGPHTIKVVVDATGRIQETNESDNTRKEIWYWQ